MKKLFLMVMTVVLCCSFAACVPEDVPTKEQAEVQSEAEEKDETFGLNESAVFKDLKFTATEIEESNGEDFFEPKEGNVFIGIKFTIENISDEEQAVSTLLLFEGYVDEVKCEYSINAACVFDEGTLDGTVAPGRKLVGWYALEVPENWTEIELSVQTNWLSGNSAKFVFTK